MSFKRLVFLFLFILFFASTSFSAVPSGYNEKKNSSYYNISVDEGGWCSNINLNFKVYRSDEMDIADEISIDPDRNFSLMDSYIQVFDGPFEDEGKILLSKELVNENSFDIVFPRPDIYLLQVYGKGGINPFEDRLTIEDCGIDESLLVPGKPYYFNLSFSEDENLILEFNNSLLRERDVIFNSYLPSSLILNNFSLSSLGGGNLIYFNIDYPEGTEAGQVTLRYLNYNSPDYSLYRYMQDSESFLKLDIGELRDLSLKFDLNKGEDRGYFVLVLGNNDSISSDSDTLFDIGSEGVSNLSEDSLESRENSSSSSLLSNNVGGDSPSSNDVEISKKDLKPEDSTIPTFLIVLLPIVVLFVVGFFVYRFVKSSDDSENNSELKSYTEIYSKTKDYVKMYRNSYPPEAIRKSLEKANVDPSIIDRVFNEEF